MNAKIVECRLNETQFSSNGGPLVCHLAPDLVNRVQILVREKRIMISLYSFKIEYFCKKADTTLML